MNVINAGPTILPALRGVMGNWIYYSCLMQLSEVSSRIRFADEVHQHHKLSEMIQRSIDRTRIQEITDYIRLQPQRFFNSLVVAVYGGEPNWHALSNVRSKQSEILLKELQPETINSIGFLTLRGDENLFALDGQHRLAGIKAIADDGFEPAIDDEISVILVSHAESPPGLVRTRRLFTTLNKTGRKVTKGDIIALDEDDVMAICVRRLIEQTELFRGDRILFVQSNNVPSTNIKCLTTIGNLYDILTVLFTQANFPLRQRKKVLESKRPNDDTLDQYCAYAKEFFVQLSNHFPEIDEFFSTRHLHDVVGRYRGRHGGSALYRPIGLEMFTRIITRCARNQPLESAIRIAAKLPRDLHLPPYDGLMWNRNSGTIISSHRNRVTLREILCYMIGASHPSYSESELLNRYRRDTGNEHINLPSRVI